MNEIDRYEYIDMPFYRSRIAPILPPKVLDFHAHAWCYDQWLTSKGDINHELLAGLDSTMVGSFGSAKYMATEIQYTVEQLLADGRRIFPDREYQAVCFGQPTPSADIHLTNQYILHKGSQVSLYPLLVAGGGKIPIQELRKQINLGGFFGIKVFLNWIGNDYKNIQIEDMLTPEEMEIANDARLVVLLHVPRSERLADPEIQLGVKKYALRYPKANIVLAHCGRCYNPDEMRKAIHSIHDLDNVYMDTSMVMDPLVLERVIREIGSQRLLFATDFPVAAMRGRRVNIMDHWVDVVLEGYPQSDYRVASNGIRASFMAYEIAMAIELAAEASGLTEGQLKKIFFDNGVAVLKKVMEGEQWKNKMIREKRTE